MEKYGVDNVAAQQKAELKQVQARMDRLMTSSEKTASQTQELEQLRIRCAHLKAALQGAAKQ